MNNKVDTSLYDTDFYKNNKSGEKLTSVDIVLAELAKVVPRVSSAVDFGCGAGTWLAGLGKYGVSDICGFDGKWVNKDLLVIPKECFFEADLEKPIELKRRFDLAISIEVAEHLSENSARDFVKQLVNAADIVLFSAAIPFQGGDNHINEQWPAYWNSIFNTHNYIAVDCLRKILWANSAVSDIYKQNILVYVKRERLPELAVSKNDICIERPPLSLVTPERYLKAISRQVRYIKFSALFKSVIARMLGKNARKLKKKWNKLKKTIRG